MSALDEDCPVIDLEEQQLPVVEIDHGLAHDSLPERAAAWPWQPKRPAGDVVRDIAAFLVLQPLADLADVEPLLNRLQTELEELRALQARAREHPHE